MFRRRSRSFSRFRSRFKRRKRSLYAHSGGAYQMCQFYLPATFASSEAFSNVEWTELLKIEDHIGDSTSAQGAALNQIARYIEVRAIQWDLSGYLRQSAASASAIPRGSFFAGLAIDRLTNDVGRPPVAAANFDPFKNESPISAVGSAAVDVQDYTQPMRWLRSKAWTFPTGNFDNVASVFTSNSGYHRWSSRYKRPFRLSDETGLYFVRAFADTVGGGGDSIYDATWCGKLWYRVGFGR